MNSTPAGQDHALTGHLFETPTGPLQPLSVSGRPLPSNLGVNQESQIAESHLLNGSGLSSKIVFFLTEYWYLQPLHFQSFRVVR